MDHGLRIFSAIAEGTADHDLLPVGLEDPELQEKGGLQSSHCVCMIMPSRSTISCPGLPRCAAALINSFTCLSRKLVGTIEFAARSCRSQTHSKEQRDFMNRVFQCLFLYAAFASSALAQKGGEVTPEQPPLGDFNTIAFTMSDANSNTLSMDSSWGHVTIDTVTNTAYLATPGGIQEFSTSSALSAAGISPSNVDFSQGFPGIDRSMLTYDPWDEDANDVLGPCALSPCVTDYDPVDGRIVLVPVVEYEHPGLDPAVVEDAIAFENWQEERCEEFNESVINSSLEAPAVGAACALFETGGGAIVCAGGLIKQAWDASRRASSMTDCKAAYPGPGQWRGSTLPKGYGQ